MLATAGIDIQRNWIRQKKFYLIFRRSVLCVDTSTTVSTEGLIRITWPLMWLVVGLPCSQTSSLYVLYNINGKSSGKWLGSIYLWEPESATVRAELMRQVVLRLLFCLECMLAPSLLPMVASWVDTNNVSSRLLFALGSLWKWMESGMLARSWLSGLTWASVESNVF